jgi:hypothetical protein
MRLAFPTLVAMLTLSSCALSVGAGASGRLAASPDASGVECDNFESCDLVYRDAVAEAERCHRQGDAEDCEAEDHDVAATYEVLHEETLRELDALRGEASEKETALEQADEAVEAARHEEQDNCSGKGHPTEPPPVARHGNGWFESDSGVH